MILQHLPDHQRIDKLLIESVYRLKETDPGKRANRLAGGWHSADQVLAGMPGMRELSDFILASNPGMVVYLLWTIVNPKGVQNGRHPHTGIPTVCVYYPKPNPARIVFYGPETFSVEPEAGLLLTFEGTLEHSVEPNPLNEDRISINFDLRAA